MQESSTVEKIKQSDQLCSEKQVAEDPLPTPEGQPASEQEIKDLFHVVDDVPLRVWLATVIACSERFVWFGATAPFQNYLQNDPHNRIPGALGLDQARATLIMTAFFAFSYFTPIFGAVIADAWLGRYLTMLYSAFLILLGTIVLFLTSLPAALQHEHTALSGLIVAMMTFAFGCGAFRTAATPWIVDQYTETRPRIKIKKSGERVVTDRQLTVQFIYNAYYWSINVVALGGLVTTFLERYVGFWAAYLPAVVSITIGIILLIVYKTHYVRRPASGTIIIQACKVMLIAVKRGFRMDAAKPENLVETSYHDLPWDARFVDELKLGLFACRILLLFPFHWLCLNQTFNNYISQAGQMVTSGVPNDAIKTINPASGLISYPLIQNVLYPFLRRRKINFGSARRITLGFVLLVIGTAYAAGLQQLIYDSPPCYDQPLACPASNDGKTPNQISMFLQTPIYVIEGVAEMFCLTTGTEHAYNQAPNSVRSIVSAYSIAMAGLGSLLAMAFTPLAKDPYLVIMYSVLAGILFIATVVFWFCFRNIDKEEIEMLH